MSDATDTLDLTGGDRSAREHAELDLAVALAAARQKASLLPGRNDVVAIDVDLAQAETLVPHAPTLGAWIVTDHPTSLAALRRAARPVVTVAVRAGGSVTADVAADLGADLVVVPALRVGLPDVPVLLEIGARRRWQGLPHPGRTDLRGFSGDLAGSDRELGTTIGCVRSACTSWSTMRRPRHPVVLVRAASPRAVRMLVSTLVRELRARHVLMPVLRLEMTRVVLDLSVTTRVAGPGRSGCGDPAERLAVVRPLAPSPRFVR